MIQLQNNFTTSEQSKRLLELGVPADSADCYYFNWNKRGNLPQIFPCNKVKKHSFNDRIDIKNIIPCWSVGRLIELHELLFPEIDNFIIEKGDMPLIERMVRYFEICKEELDFSKLENKI